MADRFEGDADESAKRLRDALERKRALWARNNKVMDVTPGMLQHRDAQHCLCDDCTSQRKQAPIGAVLRNTNHRRKRAKVEVAGPDASVGSPPKPRQETYEINAPDAVRLFVTPVRFGSKLWAK